MVTEFLVFTSSSGSLRISYQLLLNTVLKLLGALGLLVGLFLLWRKQFLSLLWTRAAVTRLPSSEGWSR